MFVAFDHHVDGKLLKCFVTRCRNLTYQRIPAAKEDLEDLEDDTYLGQVSKDAYEKSLQKYHPWIVQVGANIYHHFDI